MDLTQAQAVVVAALIAISGVAATLAFQIRHNRQDSISRRRSELGQRQLELLISALGYLEGKSQRRSVGLTMLAVLHSELDDKPYQDALFQLLLTQLRYLLAHGSNRWEGHELINMEIMLDTLQTRGKPWINVEGARITGLLGDIERFLDDSASASTWALNKERADGGRPNQQSIEHFRRLLENAKANLN